MEKEIKNSIGDISIKTGIRIFLFLIVYFMVMKYTGLVYSAIAWFFNFIMLFLGMIYAFRSYRNIIGPDSNVDYLPGFILGCTVTIVTVIPYVVFIYVYFAHIDPPLLMLLKNNVVFMSEQITAGRAAATTLLEGLSSGFVMSFVIMQYYKSGFRNNIRNSSPSHG